MAWLEQRLLILGISQISERLAVMDLMQRSVQCALLCSVISAPVLSKQWLGSALAGNSSDNLTTARRGIGLHCCVLIPATPVVNRHKATSVNCSLPWP